MTQPRLRAGRQTFGMPNALNTYELKPTHPVWSTLRRRLTDLPHCLFAKGSLKELSPAIALVGTRHADEDSIEFTRRLAAELARAGCTILSGGASGIDTAAHQGALEAGGTTVAVVGTPLDRVYPKSNQRLFEHIVACGGALLSEQPPGGEVFPAMFVRRNRLIAALATAAVVVRAPAKSGALSTARWAQKLETPVFFVPASPWDSRGAGCIGLAKQGAHICTSAQDVLSHAAFSGLMPQRLHAERPKQDAVITSKISGLDDDSRAILRQLAQGSRVVEQLAAELQFSAKRVQRALVMLCLSQDVVEKGAGQYGLVPRLGTKG